MIQYYDELTSFSEEDWDKAVRLVFPKEFQRMEDEKLEMLLKKVLTKIPHLEQEILIESLGKIARDVGKFAKKNAGVIGTVGGAVAGAIVGGPVGAAAGAKLGGTLGSKLQGGHTGTKPNNGRKYSPAVQRSTVPSKSSSPELNSLMLANNPQYLIALIQSIVKKVLLGTNFKELINPAVYQTTSQTIEEFSSAIAVFADELAHQHRIYVDRPTSQEQPLSPELRAVELYKRTCVQ